MIYFNCNCCKHLLHQRNNYINVIFKVRLMVHKMLYNYVIRNQKGGARMFEPWQLAMIDEAGYNGIRDEHIERVARSLLSTGLADIDRSTFEYHCRKCGINPANFTQADLDRLQRRLNK